MSNESSPISGMAKNVKRRGDTIRRLSLSIYSHALLSLLLMPLVDALAAFRAIFLPSAPPISPRY